MPGMVLLVHSDMPSMIGILSVQHVEKSDKPASATSAILRYVGTVGSAPLTSSTLAIHQKMTLLHYRGLLHPAAAGALGALDRRRRPRRHPRRPDVPARERGRDVARRDPDGVEVEATRELLREHECAVWCDVEYV